VIRLSGLSIYDTREEILVLVIHQEQARLCRHVLSSPGALKQFVVINVIAISVKYSGKIFLESFEPRKVWQCNDSL